MTGRVASGGEGRPRWVVIPWALVTVLVAVAACSQPATLDGDRTEASIRSRLAEALDLPVSEVSCPGDVAIEAGGHFRCQATTPGGAIDVVVRQTDDDGALAVEPTRAVLVTERVVDDIVAVLGDRFDRHDATVTCDGPDVRIEEVGATFTCEARDGAEARTVEVRVRDTRGALTYSLSDPEGGGGG